MMDDISRRQAVAVAALTGAQALIGLSPALAAAADKPKQVLDEKAERQHVLGVGFTEAEADCWLLVARTAGSFFDLPKLHPMDDHEVAHAIHVIQNKLLSRPTYRRYRGVAKGENK
jgi:hypothetical protein